MLQVRKVFKEKKVIKRKCYMWIKKKKKKGEFSKIGNKKKIINLKVKIYQNGSKSKWNRLVIHI